jgi:hypothetical protein
MPDTATYWAPSAGTDAYGKRTFSAPVQLACRWEDKIEQIRSKTGVEYVTKSRIFLSQPVDLDGYVYFGESSQSSPYNQTGAWEIQQVGRSPDLRGLKSLTVVHI